MRLAGIVLLAILLMATLVLWKRNDSPFLPHLQSNAPTIIEPVRAHENLAPVERPTSRAPVPDPVVEIDPVDYQPEDASVAAPPTALDPELQGIEVAGTLFVSPAWNDVKTQVLLCRVGATEQDLVRAQPVRDEPGSRMDPNTSRWQARVQGAGRYWIGTVDPASTMEIDVVGNMSDVRLFIPDPVQMECVVVDARTQEPVTGAYLMYQPRVSSLGHRPEKVIADASIPGLYRWRCVPGDGALSCSARKLAYEDQRIDCTAGPFPRSLRMELLTASCIRVRVTIVGESASAKDRPADVALAGVILERNGVLVPWKGIRRSFSPGSVVINIPDPDTYVVRIAKPPTGYREPPSQAVLVREHECSELAFELGPE